MKNITKIIIVLLSIFNLSFVYAQENQIVIDEENSIITYNDNEYTYEIKDKKIILSDNNCIFTKIIESTDTGIAVNDINKCSNMIDEVKPIFSELEEKYNMSIEDIIKESEKKELKRNKKENSSLIRIVSLVMMIISLLNIVNPMLSWNLAYGFKIKNAKPTEFILNKIRICSVIILLIAIILLFI